MKIIRIRTFPMGIIKLGKANNIKMGKDKISVYM